MTQEELEQEMYGAGCHRANNMMDKNEDKGRANNNPYAQAIFRRFVLPLAEMIEKDLAHVGAGRRAAHIALLRPLPTDVTAFIAVRATLNHCLSESSADDNSPGRYLMHEIGRSVYHEYLLQFFEAAKPELFHALVNDFDRRASKNERHKMTVFKMQAKAAGVDLVDWGIGGKQQVGGYLIECLSDLGMVEVVRTKKHHGRAIKEETVVSLSPGTVDLIGDIREFVSESTPMHLPCVEKPRDWTTISDGGYHTPAMRRVSPWAIRCRPNQIDHFRSHKMPVILEALNALQSVRWRINKNMLHAITEVARRFDMDEIVSQAEIPRPGKPTWLHDGMDKADMTPEQLRDFVQWKHATSEWYTEMKLRGSRINRFYTASRVARKFQDCPAIHFVYFADFRGRFYAQTTGVNPQGSDLQKALLEFADGKKLDTPEAVFWFYVTGANRFGYDKATLENRAQWVADRHDMLIRFAEDPLTYSEWREADAPLQFLAWCMEFKAFHEDPDGFESRISVGMDGSCNGLQNFSAMLRDEVGGVATNLVPSDLPKDIYGMVAERTTELLRLEEPSEWRTLWLEHGINRTLVKRSVMTLPYGSTRYSCSEFIIDDYMKKGKSPTFVREQYRPAATYLSHIVWRAIADVVVKSREAMDWLQKAAVYLVRNGHDDISWVTPSGFPAMQAYRKLNIHRINTRLLGGTKIRLAQESDEPCVKSHKNGIAPNFIHSMDASHMHLTVLAASRCGIDGLAMVHDDFGCHAADAPELFRIIREVFVEIYESYDPLEDFARRYPELTSPPAKGSLDIHSVLESDYFFS